MSKKRTILTLLLILNTIPLFFCWYGYEGMTDVPAWNLFSTSILGWLAVSFIVGSIVFSNESKSKRLAFAGFTLYAIFVWSLPLFLQMKAGSDFIGMRSEFNWARILSLLAIALIVVLNRQIFGATNNEEKE